MKRTKEFNPLYLALGIPLGVALGAALDNLGLGIVIGLSIGAAFAGGIGKVASNKGQNDLANKSDQSSDN